MAKEARRNTGMYFFDVHKVVGVRILSLLGLRSRTNSFTCHPAGFYRRRAFPLGHEGFSQQELRARGMRAALCLSSRAITGRFDPPDVHISRRNCGILGQRFMSMARLDHDGQVEGCTPSFPYKHCIAECSVPNPRRRNDRVITT